MDGTLLFVNRSWSEHLGYRQEEIQGRSIYDFIYEEDRQAYRDYRQQVIEGHLAGTPFVFRLQTKAGGCMYVEGVVSAKHLEGNTLYTRGIFRDITVRMENERKLKQLNSSLEERQQNLHQLLVHAPDAMIVIDQESCITFWNPKAEEIFGWTAAEVLHQPLATTIIPPQHREAHEKGMKRYLATGQARVLNRTIEITALNKKGKEFYVSLTISQAVQENKVVFISFLRDISEQKKNQLELEEKTRQLEQTNKSLEAFAYAASHDLKEPIRKIHIFSDRLKQKWFDRFEAEDRYYLERIESATIRMKTLIDDLLSYSTISNGVAMYENVNLADIIKEVLEDLELSVQEKDAVIRVDALPVVQGHARQLHQAFQNLLDNALKYSQPDVQPRVHIRSRMVYGADLPESVLKLDMSQQFYLIEVEDNGVGFEQKNAERIFQVFTRLHGNADQKGSGVGLSIVQKVISNHGGFVWAESEPGKGTTFYIALPWLKRG